MSASTSINKKLLLKWAISIVVSIIPLFVATNDVYTAQIQHF